MKHTFNFLELVIILAGFAVGQSSYANDKYNSMGVGNSDVAEESSAFLLPPVIDKENRSREELQVLRARYEIIGKAISDLKEVQEFTKAVRLGRPEVKVKRVEIDAIDCNDNMPVEGDLPRPKNKDFCAFSGSSYYGWYADPSVIVQVKGYIYRQRALNPKYTDNDNHVFPRTWVDDVKIMSLNVLYPIRNGLE
jgi:hypothetical protein